MSFLGKERWGVSGLGSSACKIPNRFPSESAFELHLPRQTPYYYELRRQLESAELALAVSGYGDGPNRRVVKVPDIVPGKIPNPASISGKRTKTMSELTAVRQVVRYEEVATDPTAVWRIVSTPNLRPSEEPRNLRDLVQPAEVEMETTRRSDELRRIHLNSTQEIQPREVPEANLNSPLTGLSEVVATGWEQDLLPNDSWREIEEENPKDTDEGEFGIPSWLFELSLPDAVDRAKDLAILEMDGPTNLLKPINVGLSSVLRVGQQCLVIENPFGFDHTLTVRVISGLNRDIFSKAGVTIEDGAHFHMKLGAFLYNLEAQMLIKSHYCYFIRLMLEYFKFSSLDSYEKLVSDFSYFLKRLVSVAMDRRDKEKEMVSVLLSSVYGAVVKVKMKGKFHDDTVFLKKWYDEEPFEFKTDEEEVIDGLDYAVLNMKKGEDVLVTTHPEYAIGFTELKQDFAVVPTNSILIHEVKLVSFVKDKESVYALAMNDTGSSLVSGGTEMGVRVWDPGSGVKSRKWEDPVMLNPEFVMCDTTLHISICSHSWGRIETSGNRLSFNVITEEAFEVSLADVSQTQMQGETDVEFSELVVVTFDGVAILTPRELAKQVHTEIAFYGAIFELSSCCVYGGSDYRHQEVSIRRGVDIIVGTPGRVKDFIVKGTFNLKSLRFHVLDDAGELSFIEGQIAWMVHIIAAILKIRQTIGCSRELQELIDAELSARVLQLINIIETRVHAQRYQGLSKQRLDRAILIFVQNFGRSYVGDPAMHSAKLYARFSELLGLNDHLVLLNAIVGKIATNLKCCAQCENVIDHTLSLFPELALGYMTGKLLLKLDINDVQLIIQCEPPRDGEAYIHWSGRTGRILNLEMGTKDSDFVQQLVSYNQPSGEKPYNIGFLQVATPSLQGNRLTGKILEIIGLIQIHAVFDMSENEVKLESLTYLNLPSNNFKGGVPSELGRIIKVDRMDPSYIEFSGPVPVYADDLEHLLELNLSKNHLHGSVPAGSWVLIEVKDASVMKTATICPMNMDESEYIFRPLHFNTLPAVKLTAEPLNPSELPKIVECLRKISKSYPSAITKVEESGEHIILETGELCLDSIRKDQRELNSEAEVKAADPVVTSCKTVVDISSMKCFAETPNQRNKVTMVTKLLEKGWAEDIENGLVSFNSRQKEITDFFQQCYQWDVLAARSIGAFGPEKQGPNILLDDTLSVEVGKNLFNTVKIQGYKGSIRFLKMLLGRRQTSSRDIS